ncbi:protein boule [Caerostris extrusa]|uniref:Protein boule n=1 Tax=Caerostris extrusa TaxID=172846 RepID=A0AAV4T4N4_CAEEX|nr:protein boule [Caerostris extrusa]
MATGGYDETRSNSYTPKRCTPVPNRVFVGGISGCTNEEDLKNLFSKFGNVKGAKVIFDKAGISRGYGFVTFETEDEVQEVLERFKVERLTLKDRKLNVAPAVKKKTSNRATDNSIQNAPIVFPVQPYSRNSVEFIKESVCYPQASWSLMWPQYYFDQQYHYPSTLQVGLPQYVYPIATADLPYQPVPLVADSDYSETSSADSENTKNPAKFVSTLPSDFDRGCAISTKPSDARITNGLKHINENAENPISYMHPSTVSHLHPVLKTLNGVAVMAYPNSILMGNPAVIHVKDGNNESDNALSELGYMPGTLTPTPIVSFPYDINTNMNVDTFRKCN